MVSTIFHFPNHQTPYHQIFPNQCFMHVPVSRASFAAAGHEAAHKGSKLSVYVVLAELLLPASLPGTKDKQQLPAPMLLVFLKATTVNSHQSSVHCSGILDPISWSPLHHDHCSAPCCFIRMQYSAS